MLSMFDFELTNDQSMEILKMELESKSNGLNKIEFDGNAREYFGIWIVNLILSIVTLGIYSAWAKVRTENYFKNNTKIFNSGFGYHATGGQIFKGRFIAFIVLVAISVLTTIQPALFVVLYPVLFFLVPWILNNSMRFAARMTSYRNIRFNWHGTYWETFWYFLIAPLIGILSLGLLTPLIDKSYYAYFARSHSYGTTTFSANPKVGDFYKAFLAGVILPTAIIIGVSTIPMVIVQSSSPELGSDNPNFLFGLLIVALYASIFSVVFIYGVLCRNLLIKSLVLDDILTFDSQLNPWKFVWIALSNLVLTILSLGLMLPWAQVRMYRYLSNSTLVRAEGDIEKFVDEAHAKQSSLGEAIADFEGIEVTI